MMERTTISQEPSSWPALEFNTLTDNLETRNVHVTLIRAEEDFTQKFSKLNRHIRFNSCCRRFVNNCRQHKDNRQTTTLTTQDLVQVLTCCVKMVQQTSYTQEVDDDFKCHYVSTKSILKTLHPFIDQEGLIRMGGRLQKSTHLNHIIHQVILPPSHHLTK
jgi:hypothetical protein